MREKRRRDADNRFADVVRDVQAKTADLPVNDDFTRLSDVMPASDVLRQADMLDALRPGAKTFGSGVAGLADVAGAASSEKTGRRAESTLARVRSLALRAAMSVATPLRDEIDRVRVYSDAVASAYRVAANRIDELETDAEEMRRTIDDLRRRLDSEAAANGSAAAEHDPA